ncbi:MAG: IS3 family transposase [Acidimicrobiales bacterium]
MGDDGDPEVPARARRRAFSARYKLDILARYEALDGQGRGALLRREGLYTSSISEWRQQREQGALAGLSAPRGRPPKSPLESRLVRVERVNRRLREDLDKAHKVIEIQGKTLRALGDACSRERGRGEQADAMIDSTTRELIPMLGTRGACAASGRPVATHYRRHRKSPKPPRPRRQRARQPRALSEEERAEIETVMNSERFSEQSPASVYATLLDEGTYLGSVSTIYRVLREQGQVGERRRQATHPAAVKPELVADRPDQVWSWDITKLLGPVKWTYYYLYVVIDIYSRRVVGWLLAGGESAALAKHLLKETMAKEGVTPDQLTIHADHGSSMASKPVALLLADLGVIKSHSRPHCSNDNPYSEAHFKTLKYRPSFPKWFGSMEQAREFCQGFFAWYNREHRHSGIGYYTPDDVHRGLAPARRESRAKVLAAAYIAHPERFVRKAPEPPNLPRASWINRPQTEGSSGT